jgi:hypothetical protein
MKPTLDDTIKFAPKVISRGVGLETVLFGQAGDAYVGLDTMATHIWDLLLIHEDLRAVHQILVDEYKADPAKMEKDLLAFVAELAEAGLLSVERDRPQLT